MTDCSGIVNFTPDELAYTATTVAVAMAKDYGEEELVVLSSFFFGVGSALGLIARQRVLRQTCCNPPEENKK